MQCLSSLVLFSIIVHIANSEIFSATSDVEEIVVSEKILIENLEKFIKLEENRIDVLKM
jgi:hypothetical protein